VIIPDALQMENLIEKAGQPLLSDVKVVWQEQNEDLEKPLQAPACIPSIFNGTRVVVYGFASNCYMVSLRADHSIKMMCGKIPGYWLFDK